MTVIDPATGWFKIVEIPTFDLEEVKIGNNEYTDKSSSRVSQLFNNTWICIYPRPRNVVFDNGSKFKLDFTPFLKDLYIKPILTSINNRQSNALVDQVNQVILNILVTMYLDKKVFDSIYPWGETLAYIAWAVRDSYYHTIMATPGQAVFGRDMLFNIASFIDWQVVTAVKQSQVDIDNFIENAKRVTHDCAIGDRVYVEITGIYRKLDYKKKGLYIITKVF